MKNLNVLFLTTLCFMVVVCKNPKARIYGGYEIDISEVPYSVFMVKEYSDGLKTACGGVILDKRYVLTAAHCLSDQENARLRTVKMRTGSNYTTNGGDVKSGEGYVIHPKYFKSVDTDYDYGIVKLSSDLDFNPNQSPAKLPGPDEEINSGHEILIAGWGNSEQISEHLKAVKLPKFNKVECKKLYAQEGTELSNRQMCIGFADPEANNKTTAGSGDSGSPAVSTTYNTVQGIVTQRRESKPTVISKLVGVLDWISEVMSGNVELRPLSVIQ